MCSKTLGELETALPLGRDLASCQGRLFFEPGRKCLRIIQRQVGPDTFGLKVAPWGLVTNQNRSSGAQRFDNRMAKIFAERRQKEQILSG